ncbi:MAG: PPC domain-containing DNA-binding protein [Nanoarchaeota archaeon]
MKHEQLGNTFVLLLSTGERAIESITAFCKEKKITAAHFTAIGAVSEVELGFYKLATKEYTWKKAEAELEIDSIVGNVAVFENEPLVHAHATVSDNEMHSFGGHLKEAVVGASCEVFLTPLQGRIERKHDEKTGLKLMRSD